MKSALKERGRALENEFFEKQNRHLIEELRATRTRSEDRAELARACGVEDERVLDMLLDSHVNAETVPALVLVPLVLVAWANMEVARAERFAILEAAAEYGIQAGTPAYALAEEWLTVRPPDSLVDAWHDYVEILRQLMDPADREEFSAAIMRRARAVAQAAGGVLGIGPKISREEQAVLDRLDRAFDHS
jgi:hypothetical protein